MAGRLVGGGLAGSAPQGAYVKKQIRDLVGGHQLTVEHFAQAAIDDREGFGDHIEFSGLGHCLSPTTPAGHNRL